MDEVFHLKAPFQPTGDQPQAIEALVQGIHEGEDAQQRLGVFTLMDALHQRFYRLRLVAGGLKRCL